MAARLTNAIGNLSGKYGQSIARTIKGITFLCRMPAVTKRIPTAAMVAVRNRFRIAAQFVKVFLTVPFLFEIWKLLKPNRLSPFNYGLKLNANVAGQSEPSGKNVITPDGFAIPVDNVAVLEDSVSVEMGVMSSTNDFTPQEKNLAIAGVVCYYDPVNPDDSPFRLVAVRDEVEDYTFNNTYEFSLPLTTMQKTLFTKYTKVRAYVAVATKSAEGKIVQWSMTNVSEVK
jgi:hypothetical protein